MNKCILVSDLLPLYIEYLLSEESKEFVEVHLKECPDCASLYEALQNDQPSTDTPSIDKEKSVRSILKGYRKWFYTLVIAVMLSSLIGGILGTYFVMKYEELVPTNIAKDFVTYALKGDRWVYQEKISVDLKEQISFDQYFDWETWEDVEQDTALIAPKGFKVYKSILAQEFGPIDVSLKVGLVLTRDGFKVFQVSINDRETYLKKKAAYISNLNNKGKTHNVEVLPTNPLVGEYFVEGRILEIKDGEIHIEQHMDTGSQEISRFPVPENTLLVKHAIVNNQDYFDRITLDGFHVGDVIAIIFTKENLPRAIILTQ
ncbi:zf-HC2 domain-containing protein [Anaerosolibacter sp.]|uniref:zf-HC2 domain-containing protein n=1 Tax=Anaerosolibacter sp. TaxID=1872527 RepID=UPI0039F09F37